MAKSRRMGDGSRISPVSPVGSKSGCGRSTSRHPGPLPGLAPDPRGKPLIPALLQSTRPPWPPGVAGLRPWRHPPGVGEKRARALLPDGRASDDGGRPSRAATTSRPVLRSSSSLCQSMPIWSVGPSTSRRMASAFSPSWNSCEHSRAACDKPPGIRRFACVRRSALVDYAPLVASPACFARAESRSSLYSDSFSPPRFCLATSNHLFGKWEPEPVSELHRLLEAVLMQRRSEYGSKAVCRKSSLHHG